jgi:hypothetical protein
VKVTPHKLGYRGFELGFSYQEPGGRPTWHAAWRSTSLPAEGQRDRDGGWQVSNVLADGEVDTIRLARECIDYAYLVEAEEALLGRKLKISELPKP